MLEAVLHALASYECTKTLTVVVMILSAWNDTPWNSTAVRGQGNISTLILIPAGHMRVCTGTQTIGRGDIGPLLC